MQFSLLKAATLSALAFTSVTSQADGSLLPLVVSPSTSAYINCFNDGRVIPPPSGPAVTAFQARSNFGTLSTNAGSSGVCQITGLASDSLAPLPGYGIVPVVTGIRTIPSVTGGSTSIGSVTERIWRKPAATAPVTATDTCIFGAKVTFTNGDHDSSTAGTQYFELNDLARGGFSTGLSGLSGSVNIGYFQPSPTGTPLYRAGRTFTSVQHRALKYGGTLLERQQNGIGYLDLPTIGGAATLAINGVNSAIGPTTIAAVSAASDQDAQINTNWVDFTLYASFLNGDGETYPGTGTTYVEADCNSDNAATIRANWVKTGAIRLRQTAQENTTFKEIAIDGFAPPGAVVP